MASHHVLEKETYPLYIQVMSRTRFAGITSRILMLIAAGVQVTTYLSVLVNPSKVWIMTVFGLLFIPVSLLNIFLLVWGMKRMSKAAFIPLLALLPSVFFFGKYIRFAGSGPDFPDGAENRDDMGTNVLIPLPFSLEAVTRISSAFRKCIPGIWRP